MGVIGNQIRKVFKDHGVVIKKLLQRIQEQYPEKRGLTENGFKYSLDNDSIKLSLLIKISDMIQVPLSEFLPKEYLITRDEMAMGMETVKALDKRVLELELDKKTLQDYIMYLKKENDRMLKALVSNGISLDQSSN